MCATSEGHSESVRLRSQPNHRPSGRTRMMRQFDVSGGKGERTHDPGKCAAPPMGPAVQNAAKQHLLDERASRPTPAGSAPTGRGRGGLDRLLNALGSRPTWRRRPTARWSRSCRARSGASRRRGIPAPGTPAGGAAQPRRSPASRMAAKKAAMIASMPSRRAEPHAGITSSGMATTQTATIRPRMVGLSR